jgi:hypothetical protein
MSHSLDTHLSSIQVHLNSKDAYFHNEDQSSSLFHFNTDISPPANVSILVSVVSFSCPMSYYVITSNNNRLTYSVGGSTFNYDIPVGNYTATELATNLQSFIPTFTTVDYSKVNNKLRFYNTAGNQFTLQSTSTCFSLIGFTPGVNHVSANNGLGIQVLLADSVVNLSGINSIYIHSNISPANFDSRNNSTLGTLVRVPIDTTRNGILHYQPAKPFSFILQNQSIDYFQIKLEDDNRNHIDLNGQHWTMTIQIDYQYLKDFKPSQSLFKENTEAIMEEKERGDK